MERTHGQVADHAQREPPFVFSVEVYLSPSSPAWIHKLVQSVLARYDLKVELIQSGVMTGPSYFLD
jgi:hypothetical protein